MTAAETVAHGVVEWQTLPQFVDTLVIGSGAGGAVMAAMLAEGGRETLLVEEGGFSPQGDYAPFGMEEMTEQYRARGMTMAFGAAPVNYVEARCLGGGSEVNSGLYHRPPAAVLQRWAEKVGAEGIDENDLMAMCEANEKDLGITPMPGTPQPASLRLQAGAEALEWDCAETPRWHRYDDKFQSLAPGGTRQSMTETFLPRYVNAGGRIVVGFEVQGVQREKQGWRVSGLCEGAAVNLHARRVVVAAGAVRTPLLLRQSGIKRGMGDSLRLHVFTRVIAEFDEAVNAAASGVGPHQVSALAPRLRLGCAVSSREHLALSMVQANPHWLEDHDERWTHRTAYYATIGGGSGMVRGWRGREAVFYHLKKDDYYDLADGMAALARLLFAAGAVKVLPVFQNAPTLHSADELWKLPRPLTPARACLTSVHLMASCPMGMAVDAFGRVHGEKGLYIADASLFCDSPNVNPQGTVMALARRNAQALIKED